MSDPTQRYEVVPLDRLTQHPDNPRRGSVDDIADSVTANGWYGALVVQTSTGRILVGNHRWQVLKERGETTVPVIWLDVDDDRARRILLADNRTGDKASYDEAGLLALLEDLAGSADALAGTGYGMDELEDLRAVLDEVPTVTPPTTGAHYAETPEEEDERVASLGHASRNLAGLRELVVVLPLARHGNAVARLAELRKAAPDASSGEVVLAALNLAAPDAVVAELEALRARSDHDQSKDQADTADDDQADHEAA